MNFEIHPRLLKSGIHLAEISRCHVLLKNEVNFPWFIVVPEAETESEDLHHLEESRFEEVMKVVRTTSLFVDSFFKPEKLNVGCIGNQVRQMHLHVIARRLQDVAWPGVVWGSDFEKKAYSDEKIHEIQNGFSLFLESSLR